MTEWFKLTRPENVSGVGDTAKSCVHQAKVHGCLEDGTIIQYEAPVVSGAPSPLPPLYGLKSMAASNTFFGTRSGVHALVPEGAEVQLPKGTKFMRSVKSASGHWLLRVSSWKKDRVVPHPTLKQHANTFYSEGVEILKDQRPSWLANSELVTQMEDESERRWQQRQMAAIVNDDSTPMNTTAK